MRSVKRLSGFEGIFGAGAYVDSPRTWGGFVHVSLGVQTCRKSHASQGSMSATTSILCQ